VSTWIKLHDNFWENPKVINAGEDAALLYVQGLSYCSRNLTDGAILTGALRYLTARKDARTLARILVREGLWTETPTGWLVHDYLKHQRSRAQIEAEREKARIRAAASRGVRANSGRTSSERSQTVRKPETDTETDNPTPTPPPLSLVTIAPCPDCGGDHDSPLCDAQMAAAVQMQLRTIDPSQLDHLRATRDKNFGGPHA
jgi:hypothetical protein